MRTMYDSVSPSAIPASAQVVAGYVSGPYRWTHADWARFPHATKIRIDVDGTQPFMSDVCDVERYDLSPEAGAAWCRERQETRGWWSAIYCSLDSWPSVKEACKAAGADRVSWWIAHWDGKPELTAGTVAKQYASTTGYDLSVISGHWFPHSAPGWSVP